MNQEQIMYRVFAYHKEEYDRIEQLNQTQSCQTLLTPKTLQFCKAEFPEKEKLDQMIKQLGYDLYFVHEIMTTTHVHRVDL